MKIAGFVKIEALTVGALDIPFVHAFGHATKDRRASDAIIVEVSGGGESGYGEGLARDYVTGETVESVFRDVRDIYWPRVQRWRPQAIEPADLLTCIGHCLDDTSNADESSMHASLEGLRPLDAELGQRVPHAARTAVELALVDLWLKLAHKNVATLLPPRRAGVEYSGVISTGSVERAVARARKCRSGGLTQLKIKVGDEHDEERVAAIREVVGKECSLRIDANAAWDLPTALHKLSRMAAWDIESCEEPLGRARSRDLPELKRHSAIPIIVDESLVTFEDAHWLIDHDACHGFNLRLNKLGGLLPTLRLARIAESAGLFCQLGSHVGETSILAAVGRGVAYHLPDLRFLEGSFGSLVLSRDIASPSIKFGYGGRAEPLTAVGLGFGIVREHLQEFTVQRWSSS